MKKDKIKIIDKKTIYIDKNVKLGKNVTIYPNNQIYGDTEIGDNVVLYPNNCIFDCIIGNDCKISCSYLEESKIDANVNIGPYARIRPKSNIGDNCKIGNFVEIKNSTIGNGTKASHLAYIGDAKIGDNCNIGCGAIFVNYDGKQKKRTTVGDNCFIGSNCNIIAPVKLAENSYICAGTTITDDTNAYDFVIGRTRPTTKPNKAKKYLKDK